MSIEFFSTTKHIFHFGLMRMYLFQLCLFVSFGCSDSSHQENEVEASNRLTSRTHKPFVAFVNVSNAVESAHFKEALSVLADASINIRHKGLEVATFPKCDALFSDSNTLGGASLVVYIVNNENFPQVASVPGKWAMVNVFLLHGNNTVPAQYLRRIKQVVLRGLGYACGIGGTLDSRCVMYYGATTAAGLDAASVSYSPYAYGPIQDILQKIGGDALFANE